jgi:hypothetical protein
MVQTGGSLEWQTGCAARCRKSAIASGDGMASGVSPPVRTLANAPVIWSIGASQ